MRRLTIDPNAAPKARREKELDAPVSPDRPVEMGADGNGREAVVFNGLTLMLQNYWQNIARKKGEIRRLSTIDEEREDEGHQRS